MTSVVLLIVTALSSGEFQVDKLGQYNTLVECHVATTMKFWEQMPINQETLCIKVETD
jgi:hypothetical protein